jgi:hypothetical protein
VQSAITARAAGVLDTAATVSFGDGFYLPERARLHTLQWTSGEATLRIDAPRVGTVPVVVMLGRFVPAEVGPVEVTAEVGERVVGRTTLIAPTSRVDRRRAVPLTFDVELPACSASGVDPVGSAGGPGQTVTLRSRGWVPSEHGVGTDRRRLGVPVIGAHAGGGWREFVARALPALVAGRNQLDFLDTYDRILSNSAYTQRWVERLWHRTSDVFHPPVSLMGRGVKRPVILSVGRFFLPGTGHNKKQLEMVQAFRGLCELGVHGWEYHLVGGCAPEHASYLDQIRAAADGLPVVLHPDATGAQLRDLYARASIFWHAAGLGEHIERHPERYEHFGITTVEAMSAGAVPVVIDAAGQVEIVEHGVSGYRFRTAAELVSLTAELIASPERLERLSLEAERRAETFGWDTFVSRVRTEVAALRDT